MRFSAISSRVKSWVSSSTLGGSLVRVAGPAGDERDGVAGPQRKTLLRDCQNEEDALGMAAGLSDLASSLSTAAFTRYAIAAAG